jgi:hypothetical protein
MGRHKKQGLEYFPFDTDLFYDLKVRKLVKYQGGRAITVYAYLLSCVYRNGYYMEWDADLPFVCSEITGFDEDYIFAVLECCLTVGLFDRALFEEHNVLTSAGIQSRYKRILSQATRRRCFISEYNLLDDEDPEDTDSVLPAAPAGGAGEKRHRGRPAKHRTDAAKPQDPASQDAEPAAPQAPDGSFHEEPQPSDEGSSGEEPDASPVCPVILDREVPAKSKQPPLAPPASLDATIQALQDDAVWYEPVCMRFQLTPAQLTELLAQFKLHCRCIESSHQSLTDAKRHFVNWLNARQQASPPAGRTGKTPAARPAVSGDGAAPDGADGTDTDFGGVDY